MENKSFTDVFFLLIGQAISKNAVLPEIAEKSDTYLRTNLLVLDRDEEAIEEVSLQINKLLEENKSTDLNSRYSSGYIAEFQRLSDRMKYLSEKMKKVAEIELKVHPLTNEKYVYVKEDAELVKEFHYKDGEVLDDFFRFMQDFSDKLFRKQNRF